MVPASRPLARGAAAVRGWPLWALPRWLLAYVLSVIVADAIAIIAGIALTPLRAHDLELFAVLLACDAVAVELTRRAGEPAGLTKEVHAVWELPIALLLPPVFGLVAPIARMALTQWRVRRALAYRRVFTAAALGLCYAAASVAFHALSPPLTGLFSMPASRVETWTLAAILCSVLRSAVNKVLVITAVKGADPATSIREGLFSREAMFGDSAELSVGVLVAYAAAGSPLLAPLALPCVTLLQRSQRHTQLVSDARIDGKTGLLNAVTWQREAAVLVTRAARNARGTPLAVAMVDIDLFKRFNDSFGHQAGDMVLAAVASTIRGHLRSSDLCGRYGGEEFVLLLPDTSQEVATSIARRLCAAVAELKVAAVESAFDPETAGITVSIGVAALSGSHRDLDELIATADHALYQAKDAGRNTVRVISG